MSESKTTWPLSPFVLSQLLGLITLMALLPLDVRNGPRVTFFYGISAMMWIRFFIARIRHEDGRGYLFYSGTVLMASFLWLVLERCLA